MYTGVWSTITIKENLVGKKIKMNKGERTKKGVRICKRLKRVIF